MNPLSSLVDAQLSVDKMRVRTRVRQAHLERNGRKDPETDELLKKLLELEEYIDGRVARLITDHPAYPWFSLIKGIGKENIGKVIGQIRVKPIIEIDESGNEVELPYADTISALWKFAGFSVEEGKAPKRVTGKKLNYNSQLRSMCWRLATSIQKAGLRQMCNDCDSTFGSVNKACPSCGSVNFSITATTKFTKYLLEQKAALRQKYIDKGYSIVPASSLPKDDNDKKYEPEGVISEGHLHNQALRKMIKLFLSCLWLEWRKAEGLPLTKPYAIGILEHAHYIDPWNMVDKPMIKRKTTRAKRASHWA